MTRQFIGDDNAVNIELGYILNLTVLLIFTGSLTGAFYLRADASSQQAQYTEFTDLGSQIARDITNMYLTSIHSSNSNYITFNMQRDIPMTLGGKGYSIELVNSAPDRVASVIIEGGGYEISTALNSIDTQVNTRGIVYSGSGEITMTIIKNNTGIWLWIE